MSGLFDQITNYSPPLLTAGQVNYKGTWSAAANSPTLVSPPASTSKGDYYVVSAAGTQFGITFAVGDWIISNGTAWEKVDLTDAVSSVFGRTGAITATSGDYTASQVTNVPAGTISSTNVQDAINELSSDIATAQNVLDAYVTNAESVAITRGQVVYAFGATGNRMSVKLAYNTSDATSAKTVGVVLDSSIAAGNPGYIRLVGVVDGLNLGTFSDGDTLYLGATAGTVTATKPYAPNHLVYVGIVERANAGNGQLYVKVQNGYELDEIHDVQITSAPASGALLVRDATNSLWKAARLTAGTNIAVTNADASVTVGVTGVIAGTNGGTGVNNGANTITLAGNVTHAGAFTQSFTATANTSLTLPTTGTLATLAGSEALSNKTITASAFNGTVGATTANTGAFTTLSATGTITSNPASGNNITLQNGGGVEIGSIFNDAGYLNLKATTNVSGLRLEHTNHVYQRIGGSVITDVSSTGLAVTGSISATSSISGYGGAELRLLGGAGTENAITTTATGSPTMLFDHRGTSNTGIWRWRNGSAAATQIMELNSTGLAVTGALSSTGNLGINLTPTASGYGFYQQINHASSTLLGLHAQAVNTNDQRTYFANNAVPTASAGTFNYYVSSANATAYLQTAGQHRWYNAPTGTAGNAISFTQAMTLDSSGSLGLGDTSPSSNGKISSIIPSVGSYTGQTAAWYGSNGTGSMRLWIANLAYAGVGANEPWLHSYQNINIGSDANIAIKFLSGGERARFDSSGNLLVGLTGTSAYMDGALDVQASGGSPAICAKLNPSSSTVTQFVYSAWAPFTTGDNVFMQFETETSATIRGAISYNRGTGLVVYGTTSDYRSKDIIGPVVDSGALIDAVPVYIGKMKGATLERPMFIAHETPAYAHTGEKDAVDAEGKPIYQQIDTSALVPVLWAEIQSLRQRVAALENS